MKLRARFVRYLGFAILALALAAAGFTLHLDLRVKKEFEGRRFAVPARIYARPLELPAGLHMPQAAVEQELRDAGYREASGPQDSGWFTRTADGLEIALRPFVFWDGAQPARRLRVS